MGVNCSCTCSDPIQKTFQSEVIVDSPFPNEITRNYTINNNTTAANNITLNNNMLAEQENNEYDQDIYVFYLDIKKSAGVLKKLYEHNKGKSNISCEEKIFYIQQNFPNPNNIIAHSNHCSIRYSNVFAMNPRHVNISDPLAFLMENNDKPLLVNNINKKMTCTNQINLSFGNPINPYSKKHLKKDEIVNLTSSLNNYFLFTDMPNQFIELILIELELYFFQENQVIYNEGEISRYIYIVRRGELIASSNNKEVKKLNQWDCFGGLGLLNPDLKRKESVKSKTKVDLFVLNKDTYFKFKSKMIDEKYKDRFAFINTISFLKNLDIISKYNLSDGLNVVTYKKKDTIIKTGDVADSMYFIKEGMVSCVLNGKEVRKLTNQSTFGESGMLLNGKRALDIIALDTTVCYELTKNKLFEVLGEEWINVILFSIFCYNVKQNEIFKDLVVESILIDLFNCFVLKKYNQNDEVFKCCDRDKIIAKEMKKNKKKSDKKSKGKKKSKSKSKSKDKKNNDKSPKNKSSNENSKVNSNNNLVKVDNKKINKKIEKIKQYNDKILIIIEGSLYYENNDIPFAEKGSVVNVSVLNNPNSEITKKIFANPDCICLESKIENIRKILKLSDSDNYNIYKRINQLKKVYLFKNLSDVILENICQKMHMKVYQNNEIIVKEDQEDDSSLYLIANGRVSITQKGNFMRHLETGSCFGESSLFNKQKEQRKYTVISNMDNVEIYIISKEDFDLILGNNQAIINYLIKKIGLNDYSIQLSDLYFCKFLGKGKFGNVNLVHNTKYIYAIKSISRLKINKDKILSKYLLNERRIMLTIDHIFICKLIKTLKNSNFCFFLIEYVNGINLEDYLDNKGNCYNLEECQFYLSIIVIILDYLQQKNIAHRDLKPSNIMIDQYGYLKLIDFGTAKVVTDYTSTIVGTPHYISPEVLLGGGYSLSCDYWSLGIIAYEIFYGIYPFGNEATNSMEIYKEIINNEYELDDNPNWGEINNFIKNLLNKKVSKRICNAKELMKLKLFANVDWEMITQMKAIPPYIPKTLDICDAIKLTEVKFENEIERDVNDIDSEGSSLNNYDITWAEEF